MHRTDAHALYQLISEFRQSKSNHVQGAWTQVLGAEYGTPLFVRRHSEVVELLAETVRQIALLPSEAMRNRFAPYAVHWWKVVIVPDQGWGQQTTPAQHIADEHLHLLGAAADVLESRLEGTALAPSSFDLDPLRAVCLEWMETVNVETDLAKPLRLALLESLEHVVWLVDNADRFGVSRVARAGQGALGAVIAATPQVPKEQQTTWTQKMVALAGALALLSGLMTQTADAIESGAQLAIVVGQVIDDLTDREPDDEDESA